MGHNGLVGIHVGIGADDPLQVLLNLGGNLLGVVLGGLSGSRRLGLGLLLKVVGLGLGLLGAQVH